jgi:hypothetical protein
VRARKPGRSTGTITWTATSQAGTICSTSQRLTIVASAGPPTLRVASAFATGTRTITVTLRSTIPGIRTKPGAGGFDSPFSGFFEEQHTTTDGAGEGGRGVLNLFTARAPGASIMSAGGFGDDGVACVNYQLRRPVKRLGYDLRFNWNHELGAKTIRRRGHVTIKARPTKVDQGCADLNDLAYGR